MPEVTIDFTIKCSRCQEVLFVLGGKWDDITTDLVIEPCETCFEEVKQESFYKGKEEGRSEGYDERYEAGRSDGADNFE